MDTDMSICAAASMSPLISGQLSANNTMLCLVHKLADTAPGATTDIEDVPSMSR